MLKEYQNIAYLELSQISEFLNKKIIIYGAGIYATMLFSFFKMEGLEDNVVCFAVSDKKENHNFGIIKEVYIIFLKFVLKKPGRE